jgi:hypothetical protein
VRCVLLRYPSDFLIRLPSLPLVLKDTEKLGISGTYPTQSV